MKNHTFHAIRTILVLTLTAIQSSAQSTYEPYNFTTLAGGGGFVSPDQTGTALLFLGPSGIARDSAGNIYVADTFNHTIRKVTANGVVTTLAGLAGTPGSVDGTGNAARCSYPQRVAVDDAGNVYVTENNTVRKVSSDGVVTTLAGLAGGSGSVNGTNSTARFGEVYGVAVDSAGHLYVADASNNSIRKLTPTGTNWVVSTLVGPGRPGIWGSADGTGSAARFNWPTDVAVDSAGN